MAGQVNVIKYRVHRIWYPLIATEMRRQYVMHRLESRCWLPTWPIRSGNKVRTIRAWPTASRPARRLAGESRCKENFIFNWEETKGSHPTLSGRDQTATPLGQRPACVPFDCQTQSPAAGVREDRHHSTRLETPHPASRTDDRGGLPPGARPVLTL